MTRPRGERDGFTAWEEAPGGTPTARPAPAVMAAGNQAIARYIKEAVGRGGKNEPADVAIVRSLLNRGGFAEGDLEDAIARFQREKLGWSKQDARVDPGGKTIKALERDGDGGGGGGGGPSGQPEGPDRPKPASGKDAADAHTAEVHKPPKASGDPLPADDPAREESEKVFKEFATTRGPLFAAMNSAADEEARRERMKELRAFDAEHLPRLRQLQATLGGRWDIADAEARDAVLAAIQLEAATDAEGDLLNNSEAVHKRVAAASGFPLTSAWCGMFTVDHYRHSGMDKELAAGFLHVDNVHDYFTYRHNRNPRRVPKWIWAEHQWHDLRTYHQERGAEREWLTGAEVWKGGDLDIRPGDTALIDHKGDGKADHIVKVASYDANTGTLLTIGGNDGGFVIDRSGKGKGGGNKDKRETAEAHTGVEMTTEKFRGGAAGGHVGLSVHKVAPDGKKLGTIFGIGRPSLVDFEDHPYDHREKGLSKPPPPLKE